jgi:hypothetical protein
MSKPKQIIEGWMNVLRANVGELEPTLQEKAITRSEECFNCGSFVSVLTLPVINTPIGSKCQECNCFYPAYVLVADKKCPLGKW